MTMSGKPRQLVGRRREEPVRVAGAPATPGGSLSGLTSWPRVRVPPAALLLLAGVSLVSGVVGGLVRLGWSLPLAPGSAGWHGALMIGGFLGTLIGLERALALDGRGWLGGPLASGLGALSLLLGGPLPLGALLITLGSLGLLGSTLAIIRRQRATHTLVMGLGAGCWLGGNLLWLAGWSLPHLTLCWFAFLVLTIVGERLDLSRLRRPSRRSLAGLAAGLLLLVGGVGASLLNPGTGMSLAGLGLLALALWLLHQDIARRTIRQSGLPRYIALCLLGGYGWLAVAGLLAVTSGAMTAGPVYDALVHSLGLGFIGAMLFGHLPIMAPVILRRSIAFRSAFYAPLLLLHAGLALRVGSDLSGWLAGRQWGGLLNALALLLFVTVTLTTLRGTPR